MKASSVFSTKLSILGVMSPLLQLPLSPWPRDLKTHSHGSQLSALWPEVTEEDALAGRPLSGPEF